MPEGLLRYLTLADAAAIQCGLALMLGALASVWWLHRSATDWAQAVVRTSWRWFACGVLVSLATSMAMLWLQSAAMNDGALSEAVSMVPMMMKETHFGHAWLVGMAALLVAGVAGARRGPLALGAAVVGTSVFALTRSVVSHAGAQGDFTLKVGVDGLHLMLTSLWVGMVLMGALVGLRQATRSPEERRDAALWITSLSETATVGLVGILITGALKAWWATPSLVQLIGSTYGKVLWVKVLLVGGAFTLGGMNRFQTLPGLVRALRSATAPSEEHRRRFVDILWIEAAVLLCTVTVAAVLSATPTPGEN